MKVKIYIAPDANIGAITQEEAVALAEFRYYIDTMELDTERINASCQGWLGAAQKGAAQIYGWYLMSDVRRALDRLEMVVYPWVPPGESWPASINGEFFHTSWRIDFRVMPD